MTDLESLRKAIEIGARKGWVTIPKAALLLRLHESTVRDYISKGWIKTGKVGRRNVVFMAEIDRYKREGNWVG